MAKFQEIEISSLGDLLDKVTPKDPDPVSGRRREYAVYRGVCNTQYSLLTSLDRLGGVNPPHNKGHLEEHILRNFIRYARPFVRQHLSHDWELLVTAQHHGLPTRLLDWTYSPLVAAHFATTLLATEQCDRAVWRLDWRRVHEHFGLKPVAFLVSDVDEVLNKNGIKSVWDLFNLHNDDHPFVCMLEPPALDARIISQNAAFTLASTKTRGLDQILEEAGITDCLSKFVIPAEKVEMIRDQLDLCRIDERKIFPDLDGIAAEMRRYYSVSARDEER